MRHLLCEVLANEIKVYQYSMMQAVFSIHDKCKKASPAILHHSLPSKEKKTDNRMETTT